MNKIRSYINQLKSPIKDSIILGALGGLIGSVIMNISDLILWLTKKNEGLRGHFAGSVLMSPWRTKKPKNFILGQILALTTGSTLGIPMVYLFKKTSKNHYLFKGGFMGMLAWGLVYVLGQRTGLFNKPRLTKTHYSALFNDILYGLITAKAIVSLADKSLFSENSKS